MPIKLDLLAEVLKENKNIIPDFVRYEYNYGFNEHLSMNELRKEGKVIRLRYTHLKNNIDIYVTIKENSFLECTGEYDIYFVKAYCDSGKKLSYSEENKIPVDSILPIMKNIPDLLEEAEQEQVLKYDKEEEENRKVKDFFLNQLEE